MTAATTTPVQRRNAYVAWATICLVWGTTYLGIKVALESIPPFLMGGLRYVIAGSILAAVPASARQADAVVQRASGISS